MRFVLQLKNREHVLRTNYHRDHPHYPIYLVIDALLSMGLVFGAVQVGSSMAGASQTEVNLGQVGGHAFSASELVTATEGANQSMAHGYWLGAIEGATYTTNTATPNVLTIDYLNPGQTIEDGLAPLMAITTYKDENTYTHGLRGVNDPFVTTTENIRGDLLTYDEATMDKLTIDRAQTNEIVTIDYSTGQNLESMIQDSEYLLAVN